MDPLTKPPSPSQGSKEALAYGIIDGLLDHVLNRHIHVLEEGGYLQAQKYHDDYGWAGGRKKRALQLKHDLMDEAQRKFAKQVADALKEPIQPPQTTTGSGAPGRV